jgi:hypothetical protein
MYYRRQRGTRATLREPTDLICRQRSGGRVTSRLNVASLNCAQALIILVKCPRAGIYSGRYRCAKSVMIFDDYMRYFQMST